MKPTLRPTLELWCDELRNPRGISPCDNSAELVIATNDVLALRRDTEALATNECNDSPDEKQGYTCHMT